MTDDAASLGQAYYETNTDKVGRMFTDNSSRQTSVRGTSPRVDTILPHISYVKQATKLTIRFREQAKYEMRQGDAK